MALAMMVACLFLRHCFKIPESVPVALKKHSLFASKFSLFRVQGISLAVPCEC